jgi:hypothetical protein
MSTQLQYGRSIAERLVALADASPKVAAWVALQLKAGRKPSQILADLDRTRGLTLAVLT